MAICPVKVIICGVFVAALLAYVTARDNRLPKTQEGLHKVVH